MKLLFAAAAATSEMVREFWLGLLKTALGFVLAICWWFYRRNLKRAAGRAVQEAKELAHSRAMLEIVKDFAQYELDRMRWEDRIRETAKTNPVSSEEWMEHRGADKERRHQLMKRLWELDGNEEKRTLPSGDEDDEA